METASIISREIQDGKYYSLGRVAVEEGGGEAGARAALNHALHAAQLGPPWIKFDKRAQNIKILFVQEGFQDIFEQSWTKHQEWINGMVGNDAQAALMPPQAKLALQDVCRDADDQAKLTDGVALAAENVNGPTHQVGSAATSEVKAEASVSQPNGAAAAGSAAPSEATVEASDVQPHGAAPRARAGGKRRAEPAGLDSGDAGGKQRKAGVDPAVKETLAQASKMCTQYGIVTAQARTLIDMVKRVESPEDPWFFANNDQNIGVLERALTTLMAATRDDPTTMRFLTCNVSTEHKQAKAKQAEGPFLEGLSNTCKKIGSLVEDVARRYRCLSSACQARKAEEDA